MSVSITANKVNAAMNLINSNALDGNTEEEKDFFTETGFAQSADDQLQANIASLIKIFLGMLGVIFVVLIMSAGYQWFMAGGDAKKIEEARDKITRAVVGLVIVISAYSITYFVFNQLDTLNSVGDPVNNGGGSPSP
ncbi:MAG: pilin [bacterium]